MQINTFSFILSYFEVPASLFVFFRKSPSSCFPDGDVITTDKRLRSVLFASNSILTGEKSFAGVS